MPPHLLAALPACSPPPKRPQMYAGFLICCFFAGFCNLGMAAEKTLTEASGDTLQLLLPATAFGATFLADDALGRRQFLQGFIANIAATHALKNTVDAERPNGGGHSFPSGHTSASFQAAAFVHFRYGLRASVAAYLAATYVGYSRVESRQHFARDAYAGAALGMTSAYLVTSRYHWRAEFVDNATLLRFFIRL